MVVIVWIGWMGGWLVQREDGSDGSADCTGSDSDCIAAVAVAADIAVAVEEVDYTFGLEAAAAVAAAGIAAGADRKVDPDLDPDLDQLLDWDSNYFVNTAPPAA